jgi:hypothetical protein
VYHRQEVHGGAKIVSSDREVSFYEKERQLCR